MSRELFQVHCKACVPPLMIDRSRIKTHIAKHPNIDGRIDSLTDKETRVSCKTKLSIVNNSCFFQLKGWYKEKADSAYRPVLLKHKEVSRLRSERIGFYHRN